MTGQSPDWKTLNAYVDGELDAREAAAVARAAGADDTIAEQIALLYHVKGGVHGALPQAPADLAGLLPPVRKRRHWPAIAATIAAVVFGGLVLLSLTRAYMPSTDGHEALIASARMMHQRWLQKDMNDAVDTPPVVLAALTRFGRLPVVPDLESTGLSVGMVKVSDRPEGRMLQIGYRGHHGCHLSLFVFTGDRLSNADIAARGQLERSYAWHVGDLGYLLFAQGMDKSRFALIAEKVEHATRVNAPLDEQARQQLAENKRNSASCAV